MTRKPKPTIAERAGESACPNCGKALVIPEKARGGSGRKRFCDTSCKQGFEQRALVEGRAVIALLKAWRIDRGSGEIAKAAFAEVCRIVDSFNAADAEAKPARPRADFYAAKLLADGRLYIDRKQS